RLSPRAAGETALQGADSAARLAWQRCGNGSADGFRGGPRNEGGARTAPTPGQTAAQATLRVFDCDRRTFGSLEAASLRSLRRPDMAIARRLLQDGDTPFLSQGTP